MNIFEIIKLAEEIAVKNLTVLSNLDINFDVRYRDYSGVKLFTINSYNFSVRNYPTRNINPNHIIIDGRIHFPYSLNMKHQTIFISDEIYKITDFDSHLIEYLVLSGIIPRIDYFNL